MVTKVKYIINVNFKIKIAKIICFKSLTSKTQKFCTPHTNYQLFFFSEMYQHIFSVGGQFDYADFFVSCFS